jgi:hypothetical protein
MQDTWAENGDFRHIYLFQTPGNGPFAQVYNFSIFDQSGQAAKWLLSNLSDNNTVLPLVGLPWPA